MYSLSIYLTVQTNLNVRVFLIFSFTPTDLDQLPF